MTKSQYSWMRTLNIVIVYTLYPLAVVVRWRWDLKWKQLYWNYIFELYFSFYILKGNIHFCDFLSSRFNDKNF